MSDTSHVGINSDLIDAHARVGSGDIALMLALTMRLLPRHQYSQADRAGEVRQIIGSGLVGTVLGSVGCGNAARGAIVDTVALTADMAEGRPAGVRLDVTDPEPLPADHLLFGMENVIIASHRLCWTEHLVYALGSADIRGMIRVSRGRAPDNVVNRAALAREGLRNKLDRYARLAREGGAVGWDVVPHDIEEV